MQIAFVHPDYPGSEGTGATHTATTIVELLAGRGHDVTVFCRRSPEPESGSMPDSGVSGNTWKGNGEVEVRDLDVSGPPYHTATNLNRALRARLRSGTFDGFDLVHSYLPSSISAVGAIGEMASTTAVVTLNAYGGVCPKNDLRYMDETQCRERSLHRCGVCSVATSPGHDEFGPAYRATSRLGNLRIIRKGLQRIDGVDGFQALSPHVKAVYVEFGFPGDRIGVVPNPLDRRFCRSHSSDFGSPYELLYVGDLERHKGVDRLIPTFEDVRERGIDATLSVVGDGGRRSAMQRLARERGVAEFLTFHGHRPYAELPETYADHDLFVYPGEWDEPFGRVFLEALATGTPVVATDVGSVADIVGEAGVVTDDSVEAMADGIDDAIDRGLPELSDRCPDQLDRFRPDRIADELEALYRNAGATDGGST